VCPHPGLQVGGRSYFCLKVAATNGHRSKLSLEQLAFVGFVTDPPAPDPEPRWLSPTVHTHIDEQLEELARLRDVMPGYFALARRMLEDE